MKLLGIQVASGYSPEARMFANLLSYRAGGYDALVLHHDWPGDRTSANRFEEVARVPVARLDTGWRPTIWISRVAKVVSRVRFAMMLPAIVSTARRYNPDVVYSSQSKWDCLAATYTARCLNKPQIIHLHCVIRPWLGAQVSRRLLTCDHVITVSDFIRTEALRHGVRAERVSTIRNTMAPLAPTPVGTREAVRAELRIPEDAPVIGIVGRIDPYKGQHDSIAAFTKIAHLWPAACFVIIGGGSYQTQLEIEVARSGMNDRIRFLGVRSDVPRLLAALDIFVHPSRDEGFGLAVAEASAAGLPIVAYAEGAIPELVIDQETGLLVRPGDIDALAAALLALLSNTDERQRLGARGRERIASEFRPEPAGAAFGVLLGEICLRPSNRRSARRTLAGN
jgi:glycosyltransferase involved in cell wall biosynthesis